MEATMATSSPLIARLRNLLVGRNIQVKYNNRLAESQSPRSIPKPELPHGSSHKLADNHYCNRDGRRISAPPVMVFSTKKQLAEPQPTEGERSAPDPVVKKPPSLGTPPKWKLSEDDPYLHL